MNVMCNWVYVRVEVTTEVCPCRGVCVCVHTCVCVGDRDAGRDGCHC